MTRIALISLAVAGLVAVAILRGRQALADLLAELDDASCDPTDDPDYDNHPRPAQEG